MNTQHPRVKGKDRRTLIPNAITSAINLPQAILDIWLESPLTHRRKSGESDTFLISAKSIVPVRKKRDDKPINIIADPEPLYNKRFVGRFLAGDIAPYPDQEKCCNQRYFKKEENNSRLRAITLQTYPPSSSRNK